MPKPPPPRRDYSQMVRVMRDGDTDPLPSSVPYALGKAYSGPAADGADTRTRSLDEIGLPSRSPHQWQPAAVDHHYNTRETTTLYHQLSKDQQAYFDGSAITPRREDALPGPKTRAYLNSAADAQTIQTTPEFKQKRSHTTTAYTQPTASADNASKSYPLPPKQTALPITSSPSLQGTASHGVEFSLKH